MEGDTLYTLVPPSHPLDHRIPSEERNERADEPSEKWSCTDVSDLGGAKVPWRTGEDARDDDGRADVPCIEQTGAEDSVCGGWVQKSKQGSKKVFVHPVIVVLPVVDLELLHKRLLRDRRIRSCPLHALMLLPIVLFDVHQLVELLVLSCVEIIPCITQVGCLGTEEEHKHKLGDKKDLKHVEEPEPAEVGEDDAADDTGEGGGGVEDEIDGGDTCAALVDKVHVSDGSYY